MSLVHNATDKFHSIYSKEFCITKFISYLRFTSENSQVYLGVVVENNHLKREANRENSTSLLLSSLTSFKKASKISRENYVKFGEDKYKVS